jgi:hypothetical protein
MGLLWPLNAYLHVAIFHLSGPVSAVIGPVLLEFGAIWVLISLVLAWGSKHPSVNAYIWAVLLVIMAREVVEYWYWSRPNWPPVPTSVDVLFIVLLVVAIIAVWVLKSHAPRLLGNFGKFAEVILAFVALSGAFTVVQIFESGWKARDINDPRPLHEAAAAAGVSPKHGRIIWVVFDELSYQQLYGHRFAGLEMPAFDRLAGESTVFTNARPEGINTEEVLPSLMSGISVSAIRSPAAGVPLSLKNMATGRWQQFDPHDTVFQDALNAGYSTAVAGWYVPYCRIIPSVLDHCFWSNLAPVIPFIDLYAGHTFGWNAKHLALSSLENRASQLRLMKRPSLNDLQTTAHWESYGDLVAKGDEMLADPSVNFLLLHLPIPHPRGIYDRKTASFSFNSQGYIDNLALCDAYLAHLRELLEKDGTWDQTTLVVMGDHSWRVPIYWHGSYLSQEEEIASEGEKYDARPAYIVKLPDEKTAAHIDMPFAALRTRALFDALLQGRILTPQQLADWAK